MGDSNVTLSPEDLKGSVTIERGMQGKVSRKLRVVAGENIEAVKSLVNIADEGFRYLERKIADGEASV